MSKETAEQFDRDRYIHVKDVIAEKNISFMHDSLIYEAIRYPHQSNDGIAPMTETKYASPITESLTVSLKPTIEEITGLSLLPTYSYGRIYKPGNFLKKHKDRNSCEISITLNFGYLYTETNPNYTWDIIVGGKRFQTLPGDLLIYRGIELEHMREPMQGGSKSMHLQAFLHYVDANGPYADYIYDGRPGMGYPENSKALPNRRASW